MVKLLSDGSINSEYRLSPAVVNPWTHCVLEVGGESLNSVRSGLRLMGAAEDALEGLAASAGKTAASRKDRRFILASR